MHAHAKKKGGKCLSTEYKNNKQPLEWECGEGHTWPATAHNVLDNDSWCPDCSGTRKLTIADMHAHAKKKGGKCLSTEYKNNKQHLEWECAEGHTWTSTAFTVRTKGCWCPHCDGKHQTIEDMQKVAAGYGGGCLSEKYVNYRTPLEWECGQKHTWSAPPDAVKNRGLWCRECWDLSQNSQL